MSILPMNKNEDWLGGILKFLQSPQAKGLTQGLLAQAAPSMNEPRSLAGGLSQGLMLGSKYEDIDRGRKIEEGQLDLDKLYKTGMLDINKGVLDINKGVLDVNRGELDISKSRLELDRATKEQELVQKEAQRKLLMGILSGNVAPDGSKITDEQRQRAATLAAGGFVEEAFKVLTEKAEKNPADTPTKAVITQNQQVSQAVDNIVPQIDELLKTDVPFQAPGVGTIFSPAKQKAYDAKVAAITDQLISALNLPKSNESIHLVKMMVEKGFNEGDEAYHHRLKELKKDLLTRKKSALEVTSAVGKKTAKDSSAQDLVTIRNSKTGQTKQVTREEAQELTRKK